MQCRDCGVAPPPQNPWRVQPDGRLSQELSKSQEPEIVESPNRLHAPVELIFDGVATSIVHNNCAIAALVRFAIFSKVVHDEFEVSASFRKFLDLL